MDKVQVDDIVSWPYPREKYASVLHRKIPVTLEPERLRFAIGTQTTIGQEDTFNGILIEMKSFQ